MQQRLTITTIAVHDFKAMKDFYIEKFGWTPMMEQENIVFFKLNSFLFALYPAELLAEDAEIDYIKSNGSKNFTFAYNCHSEEEVNAVFEELKAKDVTIVKAPKKVFWGGYSGYISDLEGNLWEIAHNPYMELDEAGNVL